PAVSPCAHAVGHRDLRTPYAASPCRRRWHAGVADRAGERGHGGAPAGPRGAFGHRERGRLAVAIAGRPAGRHSSQAAWRRTRERVTPGGGGGRWAGMAAMTVAIESGHGRCPLSRRGRRYLDGTP